MSCLGNGVSSLFLLLLEWVTWCAGLRRRVPLLQIARCRLEIMTQQAPGCEFGAQKHRYWTDLIFSPVPWAPNPYLKVVSNLGTPYTFLTWEHLILTRTKRAGVLRPPFKGPVSVLGTLGAVSLRERHPNAPNVTQTCDKVATQTQPGTRGRAPLELRHEPEFTCPGTASLCSHDTAPRVRPRGPVSPFSQAHPQHSRPRPLFAR